ncbi:hypothetical protein DW763_15640 [Bacteroides uniformis]|uniref:Uncharacterized protein n=2 Tax=Bacteroides TaxID=816 RepID=A0A7J5P7R0_9BACE|nr:hypothetical protein [Bacteroides xylanisolvens]KAB6090841.1 hypothetical protein GA574_02500 [Bacteroides xylanisolvens]RHE13667.1 hypothetical protein DW763_15640 [Bacteroides uniformis]RHE21468.1 hypothetical protein DW758_15665 [Bacteroides uniformis]
MAQKIADLFLTAWQAARCEGPIKSAFTSVHDAHLCEHKMSILPEVSASKTIKKCPAEAITPLF